MKEMILVIRPEQLEVLKDILDGFHAGGMTISSVMGCGTQRGFATENTVNQIKGFKTIINLLPKIRVEVVVPNDMVEEIITEVRDRMATNRVGDGKIFIRTIDDAVRIRTGERGDAAL